MMGALLISQTGEIHGRGSDPYKWVSYLTSTERQHVREGTATVLIPDDNPHYQCAAFKRVFYHPRSGKFYHRNATEEQCRRANEMLENSDND